MTIGYSIYGPDNDSYMTGDRKNLFKEQTSIPTCDKCGYRTDYRHNNVHFKLTKRTSELSYTYDGVVIVSLAFKEFCNRNKYDNLRFIELEKSFGFYQMFVCDNILPFNARLTENFCDQCKRYEEVIDPSLDRQQVTKPLADGFYQSDLWFGSGNSKSPVLIIGPETKEKLKKEKFRSIVFKEI